MDRVWELGNCVRCEGLCDGEAECVGSNQIFIPVIESVFIPHTDLV